MSQPNPPRQRQHHELTPASAPAQRSAEQRIANALQVGERPLPAGVAEGIAALASRMAADDVLLQRIRGIVSSESLAARSTRAAAIASGPRRHFVEGTAADAISPTWDIVGEVTGSYGESAAEARFSIHPSSMGSLSDDATPPASGEGSGDSIADAAVEELKEIFRSGPFYSADEPTPCSFLQDAAGEANTASANAAEGGRSHRGATAPCSPPLLQPPPVPSAPAEEDPVYALAHRAADSTSHFLRRQDDASTDAAATDDETAQRLLGTAVSSLWTAIVGIFFERRGTGGPSAPPRYAEDEHRRTAALEEGEELHAMVVEAAAAAHLCVSPRASANSSRSSVDVSTVSPGPTCPASSVPLFHVVDSAAPAEQQQQQESSSSGVKVSEEFLVAAALLVNAALLWLAMNHARTGRSAARGTPFFGSVVDKVAHVIQSAFVNAVD